MKKTQEAKPNQTEKWKQTENKESGSIEEGLRSPCLPTLKHMK